MAPNLGDPVLLPCGLQLSNRLAKAALAECMAPKDHNPDQKYEKAYNEWGSGGWGAILTGNVMVDPRHCGSPSDLVIQTDPTERPVEAWKRYAAACQSSGSPALVQLNHPGRQSLASAGNTRGYWEKSIAPSAIPLNIGNNILARIAGALLFGTPKEMTNQDIETVVQQFAEGAKFISDVGFAGVEIHGAHGYLVAQFLSASSNQRTDAYGGSPRNRARFAVEIIKAVRAVVPKSFCVGIKLNSADYQHEASLEETLEQISDIVDAGIDFLEISGGSYEDPQMMQVVKKSARTAAREAFFIDFAKALRSRFPDLKLMLTGGFRSKGGMEAALAEDACDIIGLGRPAVINPHFPKVILSKDKESGEEVQMQLAAVQLPWLMKWIPIKVIGAGAETDYYAQQIRRLAKGLKAIAPPSSYVSANS